MTELDYKSLAFWWGVLESLAIVGLFFYTRFKSGDQRNTKAINELAQTFQLSTTRLGKEVHGIDNRMHRLEERTENLPTHDDIGKIHSRIDNLSDGQNRLEGVLTQVSTQVQMIHETLLARSKGE
jgi:uncharacterized coiled-coil DUF342 family protein